MPNGSLVPLIRYVVLDSDGVPVPGAKATFTASGGNTPQAIYSDAGLTTPRTNPVVADAAGVLPPIFLSAVAYRVLITDANDVTIYPATDGIYDFAQTQEIANLNASNLTSGTVPLARLVDIANAQIAAAAAIAWTKISKTGSSLADLTTRSASDLSSGTLPDARFPATLPAASGVNLTALNATQLTSGTVPDARFPATLPAASGVNLTALNGSNIASGTVAPARLGSGSPGATNFLRGDGAWTTVEVIKLIQPGTITIANGVNTNTATITSVDTAKAFVVFGGTSSAQSGDTTDQPDKWLARLALTNATTVTATRNATVGGDMIVAFTVVEFN